MIESATGATSVSNLHHHLLADVHAALGHVADYPKLTFFNPLLGSKYGGELMMIGRYVDVDLAGSGIEEAYES